MDHLLNETVRAVDFALWQLAVTGALLIPDVAAALRDPSGETNSSRYRAWYSEHLGDLYARYLSAEDAYRYRCALTHQGIGTHHRAASGRVLFVPPGHGTLHRISMTNGPGDANAIALDIRLFVADVVGAGRAWLDANRLEQVVARNLERSVRLHPQGIAPFIIGRPIVG